MSLKLCSTVIIMAVIPMLFMTGCTRLVYSHQDLLNSLKTKQDVIVSLGLPSEKREDGPYYEWLYDYGKGAIRLSSGSANIGANIYDNGNGISGNASGYGTTVTQFNEFNRYVKVTFDRSDRVIRAESQGVDLGKREPAPGKTVLVVVLLLGCVALGAALAAAGGD